MQREYGKRSRTILRTLTRERLTLAPVVWSSSSTSVFLRLPHRTASSFSVRLRSAPLRLPSPSSSLRSRPLSRRFVAPSHRRDALGLGDRPRNQNTGREVWSVRRERIHHLVRDRTYGCADRYLGDPLARRGRIDGVSSSRTWLTLASRARVTVLTSPVGRTKHHGWSRLRGAARRVAVSCRRFRYLLAFKSPAAFPS